MKAPKCQYVHLLSEVNDAVAAKKCELAVLVPTDPIFVHLHTDFWERASAYVRAGGVLYASLAANAARLTVLNP